MTATFDSAVAVISRSTANMQPVLDTNASDGAAARGLNAVALAEYVYRGNIRE